MRQAFATQEFRRELERSLGFRLRSFVRLKCVNSVNFKAVRDSDGFAFCVKCLPDEKTQRYERLALHLRQVGGGKLPSRVFEETCPAEFGGYRLICLSWSEGRGLPVDRLSREQFRAFLDDYLELSNRLQTATELFDPRPTRKWWNAALPKCRDQWGGLLRFLVRDVGEDLLDGRPEMLRTIHGDLHPGNFAFSGGRVAGFFDLENLTAEYAARDILRYIIFSYEHCPWFAWRRRRRIMERFGEAVGYLPYSRDEWLIGINAAWVSKLRKKLKTTRVRVTQVVPLMFRIGFYRRLRATVLNAFDIIRT